MLYGILKVIMWTTLHFYFRKIVFSGRRNIPASGPAILIANHSASFLDAMLLAVTLPRPLHFYARSDIFRNAWANKFLRAVNMIPVYNIEHGREELSRNEETFAEGEAVLNRGRLLLVFPEGISRVERIMLPLKKGTARVALQTESRKDFKMGLSVIPVGINYSAHRFRADVLIQVGDAVVVRDYEDLYRTNPARAMTQMTRELETKFSDTMLHVRQPERTDYINRLLELFRTDEVHPLDHLRGVPVLRKEKDICAVVSAMDDKEYAQRWEALQRYDARLLAAGLMDASVSGRYRVIVWHLLLLLIGLPFFLCSVLLNMIPLRAAKWVADHKVTRIDFYTSVANAAGGVIYLFWWLFLILVAAIVGSPWGWLLALCAPLFLFVGMYWWEGFVHLRSHFRFLRLGRRSAPVGELRALREGIAFWRNASPGIAASAG
jgi:1-acyl-sn-glycerol-3-phosphate acyltransferase